MTDETLILTDHYGQKIRLTAERQTHILEHPELKHQFDRIRETVEKPMMIVATHADETVHVYHRHYASTPVTSKYLQVIVKIVQEDAFVLTAFFSSRQKRGEIMWAMEQLERYRLSRGAGMNDCLIASACQGLNVSIYTHNQKDFLKVLPSHLVVTPY